MIKLAVAAAVLAGLSAHPAHVRRSAGYAGSLPDGQFAAFATGDCSKLKGAPKLARQLAPFLEECAMTIPSPKGRSILQKRAGEAALELFDGRKRQLVVPLSQPATIMWNPNSNGFFINDGEGSGQVSRFRYFRLIGGTWRESKRMDRAAERLFLKRQRCAPGAYANVSGVGWTATGLVKTIVQEGVHSAGCLQPSDGNIALVVLGNPLSGKLRLERVRINR